MIARILIRMAVGGLIMTAPQVRAADKGPVTGLDMPRFVSLKAGEANVRRGPGLSHRVDWVFQRRGMPLQVIAEHGHWRRVRDLDDATGWVHYSLLRGDRTAIVTAPQADLFQDPTPQSRRMAYAEQGAVLSLESCGAEWCAATGQGHAGWIAKTAIWGVDDGEVFD